MIAPTLFSMNMHRDLTTEKTTKYKDIKMMNPNPKFSSPSNRKGRVSSTHFLLPRLHNVY